MKKIGLSTVYVLFFSFAFLSFAGAQVQGPTSVVVNTTHTYSYYTNNVLGNPNWVIAVGGGGTILNQWQGSGGGYTAVYYASVQWTTTGSKTLRLRNYEMPVAEAYITVQAAPPLATPIANEATNISANSFTVSWSAVTGATSYFLEVSTTSTFTNGILHQYTTSATSYTVSNRLPSTTYHYRVKAVASGNQSNFSTSKTVKTIPPTPSAQAQ